MSGLRVRSLFLFCIALVLLRVFKSHSLGFVFLLWNLFLAWLPWAFIQWQARLRHPALRGALIVLCIAFLPNAPYIVTDLFHLRHVPQVPKWFDLLLLMSFSLLGLLFFFLTLRTLTQLAREQAWNSNRIAIARMGVMLLSAYGVYLGRYLRFNSWDVFVTPLHLVQSIYRSLFHLPEAKETVAVTFCFGIFLFLLDGIFLSNDRLINDDGRNGSPDRRGGP